MVSTYLKRTPFLALLGDRYAPTDSYPKPFRAWVVQECLQPRASMASVTLSHGINANVMRKWMPLYRDRQLTNAASVSTAPWPVISHRFGRRNYPFETE